MALGDRSAEVAARMPRTALHGVILVVFVASSLIGLQWTFSNASLAVFDSHSNAYWTEGNTIMRDYNSKQEQGTVTPEEHVLVLTPLKDSEKVLQEYFDNLDLLSYPAHLLSYGFLVSDSTDKTWSRLQSLVQARQRRSKLHRVTLLQKDYHLSRPNVGKERHSFEFQLERRAVMARSRSFLLASTLTPEIDWVLWLDSDVTEYRPTLIQDLLQHRSKGDVIVPNCMWHTYNEEGPFDRNNWQETEASLTMKQSLAPDSILIEGYPEIVTHRKLLIDLYDPDHPDLDAEVPLDGVGGCCTFVRADIHRDGAVFPAYAFDHQIETEGFAQMVKRLGGRIVGLPAYHVYHVLK